METLSIVNRIKNLAKEKGISQAFLCAQLGLRRGYLGECATGKDRLTNERIDKIADVLHTTPAYLRGETDQKEKSPGDAEALSAEDIELVKWFRSLPEEKRQAILALAKD